MDEDDLPILKPGNEPSEKTTLAMLAFIRTEHPDLWTRLKARELEMEAREEEYIADPGRFVESDQDVIPEINIAVSERFPLNSLQITLNLGRVFDLAYEEAEAEEMGRK